MAREFQAAVDAACREQINRFLPQYQQMEAEYRGVLESRKGLMTRADYRLILSCLHPDRVADELKKKYERAFSIFTALEIALLNEQERPTTVLVFPAQPTN